MAKFEDKREKPDFNTVNFGDLVITAGGCQFYIVSGVNDFCLAVDISSGLATYSSATIPDLCKLIDTQRNVTEIVSGKDITFYAGENGN